MGVYIKGMDMPGSCGHCPLRHVSYDGRSVCQAGFRIILLPKGKKRPCWCPLLLVPPHGDLVDRKKLIDSFSPADFWYSTCEENCSSAVQVVNCATTIIPAEGAAP